MVNNVIPFLPRRRRRPPTDWVAAYLQFWSESLDRLSLYIATLNDTQRETIMSDLTFDYPANEPTMITTRTFDAPRELVWRVFTEPQHIIRWWGPKSIAPVTRIDKHEFWPGGAWRFICARPDGSQEIVFYGKYPAISRPDSFSETFGVEGQFPADDNFPGTHTFETRGDKTFYCSVSLLPSFAARDQVRATGLETGARESMAQAAELVAELRAEMAK
jgi:uncharacterized protein YndB with AHSA1/START domain